MRARLPLVLGAVVLLLVGLPLAVWLDLRDVSEHALRLQVADLNSAITGIRGYYDNDVVRRVLSGGHGPTVVTSNYESIPGAIPIPATFSLHLGQVISDRQKNISYRFVSDYPFKHRAPHVLDDFERSSLAALRAQPDRELTDVRWEGLNQEVRIVAPVIMGQTCVNCHNTHPDSPKRDWKVGDVRGIQEVAITEPLATNIFSFKYLLIYFLFAASVGFGFLALQRHQNKLIASVNRELEGTNAFLSSISTKLSRYLSPQIYRSIFSGEKDVEVQTERKKLTIFFSDIKDFTATTDRLQPEELTALLNEYFTEMSAIALEHGGTIDKFVGDAMLVFFGDPETRGTAEDAKAAVRMAAAMQERLRGLDACWRARGVEEPFRARMGINTGYCNVGNFGSTARLDYTIIGGEV
ncbi:MAG: adenylate/guanylate cyclase domain-containing protein, partial [Candidatus Eremiobacteraeota bacterium]|nr:adenylate/guanylate cyclase domain-containing protein [Candidatus Eremiobacteraeota bacterium]